MSGPAGHGAARAGAPDPGAAPVAPAPFALVPYDPSKRDAYLGLLREAWGDGSMTAAEFDWWFTGNPAGSVMSTAEIDGRVVGVAAHSLARMVLGGRETLGQFSVHATTHASARGLGIFRALELRHEELGAERGSQLVLAFASAPTSPLFTGPLGWSPIDARRVWLRPLRGALRRVAGRRVAAGPAITADGSGGPLAGRDGDAGGRVRRVERFGAEADAAYRALAPRLGNHVVRDAAYLNWRFLDSPRGYRAFAATGGDGFAVLGHKLHKGVSLAVVAECVAPRREAVALLRRCLAEARRLGAEAAAVVPPAGLSRGDLLRLGFVPSHVTLDFMGKALPGAADPLDTRADAWRVSLGDTDFF